MRCALSILAACFLATLAVPSIADESAPKTPIISCGNGVPGGVNCIASKSGLKQAHTAYAHGLKLQEHQHLEEAFADFEEATRLAPQDTLFLSAREMTKSQLVFQHTEKGDTLLADARGEPAAAEFRAALKLDPDNAYVQERLADALRDPASGLAGLTATLDSDEIHLQPKSEQATFHYRGDVRGMFTELASAYGVKAQFDDSVAAKTVRFYVDDVDFFTALNLACRVSKTMWTALDSHQVLIAANTAENHKQFDRMSLATYSVPV